MAEAGEPRFYEKFWRDQSYTLEYAFDSAVRDRYPAIRRVWGGLRRPQRVLDFGCGNGVLTNWMFENGFGDQVVGVDISETGISSAARLFGRPGLRFQRIQTVAAIEELGEFDVVVASHVLEHLDDPSGALKYMAKVAPWLILEVPLEDCAVSAVSARVTGSDRRDNPVGHVNFWDRKSFGRLIAEQALLIAREHRYASAPYCRYASPAKRVVERAALGVLGIHLYGRLLSTHYAVLAWRLPMPADRD